MLTAKVHPLAAARSNGTHAAPIIVTATRCVPIVGGCQPEQPSTVEALLSAPARARLRAERRRYALDTAGAVHEALGDEGLVRFLRARGLDDEDLAWVAARLAGEPLPDEHDELIEREQAEDEMPDEED